jgi:transcriptional regulator with XRE-family HTH domain
MSHPTCPKPARAVIALADYGKTTRGKPEYRRIRLMARKNRLITPQGKALMYRRMRDMGLYDAELARKAKVSGPTISRMFKNERGPQPETLDKVLRVLRLRPDDVLEPIEAQVRRVTPPRDKQAWADDVLARIEAGYQAYLEGVPDKALPEAIERMKAVLQRREEALAALEETAQDATAAAKSAILAAYEEQLRLVQEAAVRADP